MTVWIAIVFHFGAHFSFSHFFCFTHKRTADRLMNAKRGIMCVTRLAAWIDSTRTHRTGYTIHLKAAKTIVKPNSGIFQRHFPNTVVCFQILRTSEGTLRLLLDAHSRCRHRWQPACPVSVRVQKERERKQLKTKRFFHTLVWRKCFCFFFFSRNGIIVGLNCSTPLFLFLSTWIRSCHKRAPVEANWKLFCTSSEFSFDKISFSFCLCWRQIRNKLRSNSFERFAFRGKSFVRLFTRKYVKWFNWLITECVRIERCSDSWLMSWLIYEIIARQSKSHNFIIHKK